MKIRVTMDSKEQHIIDSDKFPNDIVNMKELIKFSDDRASVKTDSGEEVLIHKIESFKEISSEATLKAETHE